MKKLSTTILLREPKQRRSQELIKKICMATLALSNEGGLRGLTTNNIAEAAGTDISSLYRFFPNKIAILHYIYAEWLGEICKVWDRYETEEKLLQLEWKEYFSSISEDWQLVGDYDPYDSLVGLLQIYPELRELEVQNLEYYIKFFVRQMKRFDASGTQKQWRDLAVYFYTIENEIHIASTRDVFSSLKAGRDLFLESMFFHMGGLMP